MDDIAYLVFAVMDTDPDPPKDAPRFDNANHVFVGFLPLVFRRAFVLLNQIAERTNTNNSQLQVAPDEDLTKGRLWFNQNIANYFNLKPSDEVVICQDWAVAIIRSVTSSDVSYTDKKRDHVRYCTDTASY